MAGNDIQLGLEIYEWNLRVSSALMVPIAIAEVALRNSISSALTTLYNPDWPWDPGFRKELPNPPFGQFNPRQELVNTANKYSNPMRTGKVVADLKFVWWEKILRARHEGTIWNHKFLDVFPNAPRGLQVTTVREVMRDAVQEIRELRNRIAHHEPIITRDLALDLQRLRRIASFVGHDVEHWLASVESVSTLLSSRPR
jgi:signal transduction histidine kinase